MSRYTCEEVSICTKSQSAICLHCNRRLCIEHLVEHDKVYSSLINLSHEVQTTFHQMKYESDKRKDIFNTMFNSLNEWKIEQIEKIQYIYDDHMKFIQSQCELTNHTEEKFVQLEQNIKQQLENLKQQQYQIANMESIHHIEKIVNKIKEDNENFKSKLTSLHLPSISSLTESSKSDNNPSIQKKEQCSSNENIKQSNGYSIKKLVLMFSDIAWVEQAKIDIDDYVKNQRKYLKLPNLICSYLTAWHRISKLEDKIFLLDQHMETIKKYLSLRRGDFDTIFGIQIFFYTEDIKEDKHEMMSFLLQFFYNHQCIQRYQLVKWYNHQGRFRYEGFTRAKQLATPFVESLLANQTVKTETNS